MKAAMVPCRPVDEPLPQPEKDALPHPVLTRNPLKRLYGWVLSWAHHPMGTWALAAIAFVDSSVFPIPGLFLQIALSMERPKRSWWYACVDTSSSVLGAIVGYYIGYALWSSVGVHLISETAKAQIGDWFGPHAFVFLLLYSFVPLPYKLATIGSGVFHDRVPLWLLLVASTIGRGARFFGLAALCFFRGRRMKDFIDRYFNLVTLVLGVLGVAALAAWELFLKKAIFSGHSP